MKRTLSEQAIYSFIELYERKFDQKLGYEEAETKAYELLIFMKLIYKPIKKEMTHV